MRIVLALGGNALGETPEAQLNLINEVAESLVKLIEQEHEIIIVHGNGPQVGMIKSAFEEAGIHNDKIPYMPLAESVAMSQGYIGFHLQNGFRNAMAKRNLKNEVTTLITQVVVDTDDDAFNHPSKPIGAFLTLDEARRMHEQYQLNYVEDSGRGYRIVVPSPKPQTIVEVKAIQKLIEDKTIVIAAGGGGIPVIPKGDGYQAVQAVIDKDSVAAKMALLIEADLFLILTAVKRVSINFGKPNAQELIKMSTEEAKQYIDEKHFAPGSMLPKIEAAITFSEGRKFAQAIIASIEDAADAVNGKAGTIIYSN